MHMIQCLNQLKHIQLDSTLREVVLATAYELVDVHVHQFEDQRKAASGLVANKTTQPKQWIFIRPHSYITSRVIRMRMVNIRGKHRDKSVMPERKDGRRIKHRRELDRDDSGDQKWGP